MTHFGSAKCSADDPKEFIFHDQRDVGGAGGVSGMGNHTVVEAPNYSSFTDLFPHLVVTDGITTYAAAKPGY